jgi:hypothetical protein
MKAWFVSLIFSNRKVQLTCCCRVSMICRPLFAVCRKIRVDSQSRNFRGNRTGERTLGGKSVVDVDDFFVTKPTSGYLLHQASITF